MREIGDTLTRTSLNAGVNFVNKMVADVIFGGSGIINPDIDLDIIIRSVDILSSGSVGKMNGTRVGVGGGVGTR